MSILNFASAFPFAGHTTLIYVKINIAADLLFSADIPNLFPTTCLPWKYLATASDALRVWDQNGSLLATGESEELLWGDRLEQYR